MYKEALALPHFYFNNRYNNLPQPISMDIEGVEGVGELGGGAGYRDVPSVHEDLLSGLVEHGRVPVAPLDGVALGLDHVPLLVLEVVLLHSVQETVLGGVAEHDEHPVLDQCGRVPCTMYFTAHFADTAAGINGLHVPGLLYDVEGPQFLGDVARLHDPAVHVDLAVVRHHRVSVSE